MKAGDLVEVKYRGEYHPRGSEWWLAVVTGFTANQFEYTHVRVNLRDDNSFDDVPLMCAPAEPPHVRGSLT